MKVKATTKKKSINEPELKGLEQSFVNKDGKKVVLKSFLTEADWWVQKSRTRTAYIVLHDAVKRIADEAGIAGDPDYKILISPSVTNNYMTAIQVTICDSKGRCTNEIGETSRDNLGTKGRANPINMTQKRAYDRAVFRHLKITGLLGEDEIQEDENKNIMDDFASLPDEDKKKIAPLINKILAAKSKVELAEFSKLMKAKKAELNEAQLSVLRLRWQKKLASFVKTF